ncbi:MAG: ribonuclease HII [Patescibacteria group bacterium]|nr:ribonuclease HII [Patescibacteria group bacterium]
MQKTGFFIGIDEAGRGPLAGPIAVGAFAVKSEKALNEFRGVKDSKQLSEAQREEWFGKIKTQKANGKVYYAVSFSSAAIIDAHGITRATRTALNRCLKKLEAKGFAAPGYSCKVMLDGSLYAPSRYVNQRTIIDGDAKHAIIALASICAKVLRDRKMKRLSRRFPGYGFEVHKGYGTKAHYGAIKKLGPSEMHRRSFLKSFAF